MEKILLVDDDPLVQKLVGTTLERAGYELLRAKDGIDAVLMARQHRPDLVVLDLIMPHVNGYDVCRQLRVDPLFKETPVILLTTREKELNDALMGLMNVSYLHKTCHPQELLQKIAEMLGHPPEWPRR